MDVLKMSYRTSPADAYLILGRMVLRQKRSDSDAAVFTAPSDCSKKY